MAGGGETKFFCAHTHTHAHSHVHTYTHTHTGPKATPHTSVPPAGGIREGGHSRRSEETPPVSQGGQPSWPLHAHSKSSLISDSEREPPSIPQVLVVWAECLQPKANMPLIGETDKC